MKKAKLSIPELEVQSFVTSLKDEETQKVEGGSPLPTNPTCNFASQWHSFCHTCEFVCD